MSVNLSPATHPAYTHHTLEALTAQVNSYSILHEAKTPKYTHEVKVRSIAELPNPKTFDCYQRLVALLKPGEVETVEYKESPMGDDTIVVTIRAWRSVKSEGESDEGVGEVGDEEALRSTHTVFNEIEDHSDELRIAVRGERLCLTKREKWSKRGHWYTTYLRVVMLAYPT